MKLAVAAVVVAACGHAVVVPRPPPDPLWEAAELLSGDGGEHLPAEARALTALDGRRALAALDGGGVAVIDLVSGEPVRAVRGAIDGEPLAMAKVGARVLAVGEGESHERAWWIDPRRLTAQAIDVSGAGGGDSVRAASGVAASDDGKQVVITGVRLPLALRDARDLSITRVLSPERNWSNPIFVGDQYVVAFHRGELVPFDLHTGKLATDRPWESSIGFTSPDGFAVIHPPDVGNALELVDLRDPTRPIMLASADPLRVAWSPDGQHMVVIDADRALVYDLPAGGWHAIPLPAARMHAVFGTDGHSLLVTTAGALWRVDATRGRAEGPRGPGAGAVAFAAPIAGGLVAIADRWRRIDAGGVRASGGWRGAGGPAYAVSPGGAHVVATSTAEGLAFVEAWDARTGAPELSAVARGGAVATDVADDGAITVATPDGVVQLGAGGDDRVLAGARWAPAVALAGGRAVYGRAGSFAAIELGATDPIARFTAFDCDGGATAALARDGARVALVSGDRVIVRDLAAGGAELERARLPGTVRAIAIDARGAIAATDDRLVLWDTGAHAAAAIATPSTVTAIGISPDGERIALGFADGRAGVWTRATLRQLAHATALKPVDEPPASCPGDPLAPDEGAEGPKVERLPR
jgi:hypothetical protein